ncbi:MAG: GNAT family N-acetyltransferase [Oscillospiraceae bacterium]|nr:GNAT family N-acetyltransferase [Oscillospiraceae bacterium]
MNQQITVREAVTDTDISTFWRELQIYQTRDIFPDPADAEHAQLDDAYRAHIQHLHDRPRDRLHYLFFHRDGRDIGFAMPVIYETEDGKCFILDFCVYPEFRGNGTGRRCAHALLDWAAANGAHYAELNHGGEDCRYRFWGSVGFVPNGVDQWGVPLMLLPPKKQLPFTVEAVTDGTDGQLLHLLGSFLAEIGETALDEARQERLAAAVREGRTRFFLARRGSRAVGLCSVSLGFSTFACAPCGVFDDFYIEPAFRRQGVARLLASAALDWCREKGAATLTVACADCDIPMYRALGFDVALGTQLAANL